MTKLVILPGNDKSNKEWATLVANKFAYLFTEVYKQDYSHWNTEQKILDFDAELKKLVENMKDKDCVVLAKSAGAALIVYGMYKNQIYPTKCVFVGFPLDWGVKMGFDIEHWLRSYNVPTLIIQNSDDPVTPSGNLAKFFRKLGKTSVKLIEIAGDDHKYDNFELIMKKIDGFLS